jgi:hypothetical protein
LFDLVLNLYAIPFTHAGFAPLRQKLHEQWEQTLAGKKIEAPIKSKKRFDVALSFPGEYRKQIKAVADNLSKTLGADHVLYDEYYEAEFARPDLDTYLQTLYHNQSELIVVFLCAEYDKKEWCGLEWKAIRDLMNKKEKSAIMFMRFDKAEIPGLFLGDGYVDIAKREADEIARLILQRHELNCKS